MGRYEPLASFLGARVENRWSASFSEIEKVLGFQLPASARKHAAWWANQQSAGHSQTSWRDAGWKTSKVDLARERVVFERVKPAAGLDAEGTDDLLARAAEISGIADREKVIREALRVYVRREAARRLIALGGTMPDFVAPPRRRFPGG